jgi:hypothetical protein
MSDLSMMPEAAFAVVPDSRVSARYGFVNTRSVAEALENEGWRVVGGNQVNTRDPARRAFAKHIVRLRRDVGEEIQVGGAIPELVIINSHNRRASFEVRTGVFRLVCSNGMVLPLLEGEGCRVRHTQNLVAEVLAAAERVAAGFATTADRINRWQRLYPSEGTLRRFAERALGLRWPAGAAPIPATDLLQARRNADMGDDLWRAFNRVQENLIRGGIRGQNVAGHRMAVRRIRSIQRDVGINASLWCAACEVERELLAA